MIKRLVKILFFGFIVKPLVLLGLGLNVRGRFGLPKVGPAVIAANHNSHLDALVLMSLYPLSRVHLVRPVAAADYFMERGWFMRWFAAYCVGIVPLNRSGDAKRGELFLGCQAALDRGEILVLFPEGSRGHPEEMGAFKKGLFLMLKERHVAGDWVGVTPVVMHGLGRALPRGEALFVPFCCDVIVGERLRVCQKSREFNIELGRVFEGLFGECVTRAEFDEGWGDDEKEDEKVDDLG